MTIRHPRRWLAAAVVAAVVVRVLYLWTLGPFDAPSDASHYHELATNLAAGRGFASRFPQFDVHPTAFRPPAFPAVLSLAYWIAWPSVLLGKLVNVALALAVIVLAFVAARRVGGAEAGVAAAWLVALYPPLVANDANLLTETLSMLLLLALVLLLDDGRWAWAGAVGGLLVLTRPSAQFAIVILAVWVLVAFGVRRAAGFAAVALLVVAPWVVRNEVQVGTTSLVTSNGFNLAAVYSDPARSSETFVDPVFDDRFEDTRLLQFDEAAWEDELRARGIDGLRREPSYAAFNAARNLANTLELWPSNNDDAERSDGRLMTVRLVALPVFYVVTVAGVVGLWRHRDRSLVVLLALVAAAFTVANVAFIAPPRLRAPLDLVCCIGAALLVAQAVRRLPWRSSARFCSMKSTST